VRVLLSRGCVRTGAPVQAKETEFDLFGFRICLQRELGDCQRPVEGADVRIVNDRALISMYNARVVRVRLVGGQIVLVKIDRKAPGV
jgi:hypothetical protein